MTYFKRMTREQTNQGIRAGCKVAENMTTYNISMIYYWKTTIKYFNYISLLLIFSNI
jgi:hypothetical protein